MKLGRYEIDFPQVFIAHLDPTRIGILIQRSLYREPSIRGRVPNQIHNYFATD